MEGEGERGGREGRQRERERGKRKEKKKKERKREEKMPPQMALWHSFPVTAAGGSVQTIHKSSEAALALRSWEEV